jgi:membrane-associated phospholipid phosphatase
MALIIPAALGQKDKSNNLLMAIALSAMVSLVILPFIQAIGPWVYYKQVVASHHQQEATSFLQALKSGKPAVFDLGHIKPLVALPSWHTIMAVLAAVALARVRGVRWLAAIWAAAVAASTVTTGWHYLVDVLAGILLAYLAAFAARSIVCRLRL